MISSTRFNTRGRRGAIALGLETVLALALVAALAAKAPSGGPGKDHWWQFWRKNPVTQAAQAADESAKAQAELAAAKRAAAEAEAAAAAKVTAEREKQLKLAHEAAIGTGAAITAAQVSTAGGKLPVRELETAARLSQTNTQAMDQALGAADPVRVRELEQMVANLNAGVAAGSKALELMQSALDRTVADKAAALAEVERVRAAGDAATTAAEAKANAAVVKLAAKDKELGAFALERDAIARDYERLVFWGKLGLFVAALVLGYVVYLLVRVRGAKSLATDLVALTEHVKTLVPPDARPKLEEEIQRDWLTVHDGTAAAVGKIKSTLRL